MAMTKLFRYLVCAACVTLAGCSSSEDSKKAEAPKQPESAAPPKKEFAPDLFKVNFDTTKGPVIVEIHRDWAPFGVDHFYTLVKTKYYDGVRFYRYHRNFIVQFGINGDPSTYRLWATANIPDDPVKHSNLKATLTYATGGPNTRTTELFFNLADNGRMLDNQGFAPIGQIVDGLPTVLSFYDGYGEIPQQGGQGPDPSMIKTQGNEYLQGHFPRLDYIKTATIMP